MPARFVCMTWGVAISREVCAREAWGVGRPGVCFACDLLSLLSLDPDSDSWTCCTLIHCCYTQLDRKLAPPERVLALSAKHQLSSPSQSHSLRTSYPLVHPFSPSNSSRVHSLSTLTHHLLGTITNPTSLPSPPSCVNSSAWSKMRFP